MPATRTVSVTVVGNVKPYTTSLKEAAVETDAATASMGESMGKAAERGGSAFGKLGQTLQNLTGIPVADAFNKVGDGLAGAETKGKSFGGTMASIGGGVLGGVALAGVAVAGVAVDLGMKFQATTATIQANGDISAKAAKQIGDAFLGTAGTTIYSANEMGQAYAGVVAQLGEVNHGALNSKQALDVMKVSTDLAEASGQDLATTTHNVATVLQTYGLGIDQASKVSDILFNTSRLTGQSVDGMTTNFQKLHSTLGVVSPSMSDMAGLLLDLTDHGETGRKALSAVNTSLNGLLAPSAAVKKAQEDLGIVTTDSNGKFIGFSGLISELQPKLQGLGQDQQLAMLKSIGFGTANKALLDVINAGPDALDKATKAVSRHGSAAQAAEVQSHTLSHEVEQLKVTAEDLGTKLGQKLIPMLEELGKKIEGVVNWFIKHKTVAEALGITLLAIAAAFVIAFIAANAVVIGIGAAIGIVIYEIVTHFTGFMQYVRLVWSGIKDEFAIGKQIFTDFRAGVKELIADAVQWFKDVKNAIHDAWQVIKPILEVVIAIVKVSLGIIVAQMKEAWAIVSTIVKTAWDLISGIVRTAWNVIYGIVKISIDLVVGIIKAVIDVFTGNWSGAWNAIKNTVIQVWNAMDSIVRSTINGIKNFIFNILNAIVSIFEAVFNGIKGSLLAVWNGIKAGVMGAWHAIAAFFDSIFGHIEDIFSSAFDAVRGFLHSVWSDISNEIHSIWSDVINFFSGIPGRILNAMSALGGMLSSFASSAWGAFSSAVSSAVGGIISYMEGLPGRFLSALGNGLTVLAGWGSDLVTGIINGITSIADKIGSAISGAITGGINSAKSALNSIPVVGSLFSAIGLSEGGYVTKPTLAWIGEAGEPEFVIPESKLTKAFNANVRPVGSHLSAVMGNSTTGAPLSATATMTTAQKTSSNTAPSVEINGFNLSDPHATAAEIGWILRTAPVL